MKGSAEYDDEPSVSERFKEWVENGSTLIVDASREQKRKLLIALEELLPNKESMLNFWLQLLFKNKNIGKYIDEAPEATQRRLLLLLEDVEVSDRREHLRKPCSIEVTYSTEDETFTDFIRNISVGGVFMQTTAPLSIGQEISLVFPFPSQEDPMKMTGEVVWKSPVGVGVKFTGVSRRVREIIESL
jgi:uncharacterized protein (TIGR02266 family)